MNKGLAYKLLALMLYGHYGWLYKYDDHLMLELAPMAKMLRVQKCRIVAALSWLADIGILQGFVVEHNKRAIFNVIRPRRLWRDE